MLLFNAASKGLGRGCAEALAEAGVNLTICARTEKDIVATANEIRLKYRVGVESVACDITTSAGREAVLKTSAPWIYLLIMQGDRPRGNLETGLGKIG